MRLKQITIIATAIAMMAIPSTANAHEIKRVQCVKYASMHAVVVRPTKYSRAIVRVATRRCWRKAKIHMLQHPLPNLPALLVAIRACESGGGVFGRYNYKADNASPTSDASGAYQYLDSTWGGHMGYSRALYAPPRIQDRRALRDIRNGGTSPWAASQSCWSNLL